MTPEPAPESSPTRVRRIGTIGNVAWLSGASVLVKPIWFVFVLILCWRILGTEAYGVMTVALWLGMIVSSFTDLGLSQYTVREVARKPGLASHFLTNLLVFRLSLGVVAWVVTIGVGKLAGYENAQMVALFWGSLYAVCLGLTNYLRSFFRAMENLKLEGVSLVLEKIVVVLAGTILLLTYRTPESALQGMAIGMVVTLVATGVWIAKRLAAFRPHLLETRFVLSSVRIALPLGLFSLFVVIYLRTGVVLLEYWHGDVAAGLYGAAYRIVEAMLLLPAVVTAAVLPRVSNLFVGPSRGEYRRVMSRSMAVTGVLALCASGVMWLLSPVLLPLINPDPTSGEVADFLRLLVWVFPIMTVNALLIVGLIAADDQRFLAISMAFITLANLALNVAFTYPYGLYGLCVVIFVTEALILCVIGLRFRLVHTFEHAREPV